MSGLHEIFLVVTLCVSGNTGPGIPGDDCRREVPETWRAAETSEVRKDWDDCNNLAPVQLSKTGVVKAVCKYRQQAGRGLTL